MKLEHAPQPSEEDVRIYREMDPVFLQFWSTLKACAIGSNEPQVYLYGADPDDVNHCVIVVAMPSGSMGYIVHQDGDHAVQMEYVKSLLGPTYFARVESRITRGPEEITLENVNEVLERFRQKVLEHLAGTCGCDDEKKPEQPQTELPLWVSSLMQEDKESA